MKYLKLFEGINDKGWEVLYDPHITRNTVWIGLDPYLRENETIVDLTNKDIQKITDFLLPYVPSSGITTTEKILVGNKPTKILEINTEMSYSKARQFGLDEFYDGIRIIKNDDDYFFVDCSFHYKGGIRVNAFKCDQDTGLISLLSMMFKDFPKDDYTDTNYRTHIKNLLKIDVDEIDINKLKSLEEFLWKWRENI